MNGAQDLGGMQGFGPVQPEADEPVFHAEWERRVFALAIGLGASGAWNIDQSRHARESMPPADYLRASYYEIWFEGLKSLLLERGLVQHDELDAGKTRHAPLPLPSKLRADDVAAKLARGWPYQRQVQGDPRFAVGERVRTQVCAPLGHTRLPRYARGRVGEISAIHGAHVYPDSHAAGHGEDPQWLYTVRFDAAELWGRDTSATSVSLNCWEPYLEPAG